VWTLVSKELAVAPWQHTVSHFLFHQGIFLPKAKSVIEDKTEKPPILHKWSDRGRTAGSAEHPHRTQLPGRI
jgi:hypothetical protein